MGKERFPADPDHVLGRLRDLQAEIKRLLRAGRTGPDPAAVMRSEESDTIYAIDALVEPAIEAFCRDWGKTTPLVVIAEGLLDEKGRERPRAFPDGTAEADALIRVILDPIDGTRGLMYDKRSAWSLAGAAANRGPATSLRDIEVAVMTELPTSKLGWSDVLWAVRGRGVQARRIDLRDGSEEIGRASCRERG